MVLDVFPYWVILAALVLDSVVGDPDWLWRRLSHPVVWFGGAISWFDNRLNDFENQTPPVALMLGSISILTLLVGAWTLGAILQTALLSLGLIGGLLLAIVASVLLAQRSLYLHVKQVAEPLVRGELSAARHAVSMIVGRDPEQLDESRVARAAIESTAENYSDGVVAPVFWFALAGFPGLVAYKMLNTADSMIGHKTERYLHFGWMSARLDDVANWLPARLTAIILILAPPLGRLRLGGSRRLAVDVIGADAAKHRSPNAGWPESAMAGRLDIALSGPRIYAEGQSDEPYVNEQGERQIGGETVEQALQLYVSSLGLLWAGVVFLIYLFDF